MSWCKFPPGAKIPIALNALGYGSLLSSIILTAFVVFAINGNFMQSAIWALCGAFLATLGIIHQPNADLTFKTFTGKEGQFGISQCGFMIGYLSAAAICLTFGVLQRMGFSRVPQKKFDKNEEETTEEVIADMVRVNTENQAWNAINEVNQSVNPIHTSRTEDGHDELEDGSGTESESD